MLTMMTAASLLAPSRPQPVPDLSREALLARLHFLAPRTGDLASVLELPPQTAGRNKGRTTLPFRRYRSYGAADAELYGPKKGTAAYRHLISAPPVLFAARIGPAPRSKNLVATAFDLTALQQKATAEFHSHTEPGLHHEGHQPGWRLLPLSSYQELRSRMDRQLEAYALRRKRWLGILLPRLRIHAATARDSDANREPPPEEARRRQWPARLERKPAPHLPEFLGIAKDPELARWKREAYRQAAVSCRNINRQSEYRRIRNRTGYAPLGVSSPGPSTGSGPGAIPDRKAGRKQTSHQGV